MTTTPTVTTENAVGHLSEALLIRLRDRLFIECSHLAAQSDEHRTALSQLAGRVDASTVLESERITSEITRCGEAIIETFQALLRLDAGTYGTCAHCGGPIPSERLEASPRARGCGACALHPAPGFA